MTRKIVEEGWESYRQKVLPRNASQLQITETRKAFYAGAWHLFASIMRALDPGTEPTEADLKMMDEVHDELKAFAQSQRG